MKRLFPYICIILLLSSSSLSADDSALKTLWTIGVSDNDSGEMALARDGWDRYSDDAFFVVGSSKSGEDWPYVHPGPMDGWAESREHSFTIVFQAENIPDTGLCRLTLDLIDTHRNAPPELTISINGTSFGAILPKGNSDSSLMGFPDKGAEFRFSCAVSVSALNEGINQIIILNAQGSWIVYDSLKFEGPDAIKISAVPGTVVRELSAPPVLTGEENALRQPVRISLFNTVKGRTVTVSLNGGERQKLALSMGEQNVEASYPAVAKDTELAVELSIDGATITKKSITLKPVRKWSVYFLPHSHVDIGYTHLQDEVMHRQWDNYRDAIDLAKKTADYPEGSKFKWNTEVLWPVDGLLKDAPVELRDDFIAAVRNGQVGIDGLYGSMLTGLARPEELYEFTSFARKLRDDYGFSIETAMITDVPGYVWGMVPTLAQAGIRYFNPGPNHMPMLPHQGDRIGYTSEEWGDKPFWWVSQSGKERVMVWIPTHGYSWFHSWILGNIKKSGADPILGYIDELEAADFPYDMVQLRYTIGADNGPPDPDLPEFVRDWNAKYAWPKMIIGTTAEMFREFEARYGDQLPEYRGDFTPYWEDGAASTASTTAINRTAAERLVQARTLWSMADPASCPVLDFDEAWRNVILYTEHTWGAHSSVSDPESDFAKGQWNVKRSFAMTADEMSRDLLDQALSTVRSADGTVTAVDIYNSSSWERSNLMTLPSSMKLAGERIVDESGELIPSQLDSEGNLAFVADNVPPLASKRYFVKAGEPTTQGAARVDGSVMTNGILTVEIDPSNGTISSLIKGGIDYAEGKDGGLNGYYYLPGRDPKDAVSSGSTTLKIIDNGPLFVTVEASSEAPGAHSLKRRYRLVDGFDYVEITNIVDKEAVTDKESVHFAFPFNVTGGEIRYDIAWGVVRPDKDQLAGGNRNFFSVNRWVDVSAKKSGITLATLDAPLIELGSMNAEEWNLAAERPWLKETPNTQTIFSYVMNNYWHTNYKAYQEGPIRFRYALKAHNAFDSADAKRFGIEQSQPLIVIAVNDVAKPAQLPFEFNGDDDILISSVTALDGGNRYMVRIFNSGEKSQSVKRPKGCKAWIGTPSGKTTLEMPRSLKLNAYEVATIIVGRG